MATSREDIKKTYPLPAYNFRVRLGSEAYAFSQVSGLSLNYETITYRHGLSWIEGETQLPGIRQPITITLERGVVPGGSVLLEWLSTIRLSTVKKQDLIIDLCDENGDPVVSWKALNAFPTQLEAPAFNAAANEVAIEQLQLSANGLIVEYQT